MQKKRCVSKKTIELQKINQKLKEELVAKFTKGNKIVKG